MHTSRIHDPLNNQIWRPPSSQKAESAEGTSQPLEESEMSGELFTENYDYHGQTYGTQHIERIATIPEMVRILNVRREHSNNPSEIKDIDQWLGSCDNALSGRSIIPSDIQCKIQDLESQYQQAVRDSKNAHQTLQASSLQCAEGLRQELLELRHQSSFNWLCANYVRDVLTTSPAMADENLDSAYAAYLESLQNIIPGSINLRRHIVEAGGKEMTVVRGGVISFMGDGYLSLDKLLEYQSSNVLRSVAYAGLDAQFREKFNKTKESTPELVVLKYACENLKSRESLALAIEKRRSFLQHQMLMLVMEHCKTAQAKGSLGTMKVLPIMQLSLLNRTTDAVDPTGWKKNEEVFMRDMAHIFKEFDGKKIILDGKGPLIDQEGNIHLPAEYGTCNNSLTLETFFANISVQGYTKNDGYQHELNNRFFEKCDVSYPAMREIENALNDEHSNKFTLSEQLGVLALKQGLYLAVNCLSGKDRTGWVCGRLGVNHVQEHASHILSTVEKKESNEKWNNEILKGPARQVCEDNNKRALKPVNVLALKLEPNLPGVSLSAQAAQAVKVGTMFVKTDSPETKKRKYQPRKRIAKAITSLQASHQPAKKTIKPPKSASAPTLKERSLTNSRQTLITPRRNSRRDSPSFPQHRPIKRRSNEEKVLKEEPQRFPPSSDSPVAKQSLRVAALVKQFEGMAGK